ncbi:conserved hypothetical protein [Verticillium alfalfae VaMs.102]|uniref:G-patch domain-containing protein n=1 Tax=Verticillium alfalfae (strain VaMs.102 / ATCC MYA-4576 / FGSC 10136) TaxID=526221 RepID=C9SR18_VERA1|nr:conserved hypothetical protein [Verticillium alfalfae VaMs.102]EEY21293.1 conserved hypothetical protein [Verticillium alfalfae VaMs.102]
MDAHALLTSQGWRGAGHSLHATSDAIGLSKPLHLNRRDGNKGIGQKAHYTSDQWWMNAFDEQLQGLSTTTGKDGKLGVVQAVQNGGRIGGVEKGAGGRWKLGGCFVKGGFLEGTIAQIEREKKKDGEDDEEEATTTSEDSATGTSTPVGGGEAKESKAQRKARRATRRAEREAKRQRKEARRVLKASKTSSKSSSKRASSDDDSDKSKQDETKEERRARREAKRIRRAAREARKTG